MEESYQQRHENSTMDDISRNASSNHVHHMLNPIKSDTGKYGVKRPNPTPRPCRPLVPPFDLEKVAEIFIRLEYIKNLDMEEPPRAGEFVVRVMYMGDVYGHFNSGGIDMQSMSYYNTSEMALRQSSDVFIEHEVGFNAKFKDLVDNPIVFHLCMGKGVLPQAYSTLPPVAYITWDIAGLFNFQTGTLEGCVEPWIIVNNDEHLPIFFYDTPHLQFSVEITSGLPQPSQLLQGNMITVVCESLHNLPNFVQKHISADADNDADVQVFMSLPHSQQEPTLKFPGGKPRDKYVTQRVFHKMSQATDALSMTQTNESVPSPLGSNQDLLEQTQPYAPPKIPMHWASVLERLPDVPLEGTAASDDITTERDEDGEPSPEPESTEIYGDGKEDFDVAFNDTQDHRIIWNSIHRKYIAPDAYHQMLSRLSQNAVWPVEISVAVKAKPKADADSAHQDPNILGDINFEGSVYSLIYHGLAFVDLSCLLCPGIKSARFACKVNPFSAALLGRKTCFSTSALPKTLLQSFVTNPSPEVKKRGKTVGEINLPSNVIVHPPEGSDAVGATSQRASLRGERKSDTIDSKPKDDSPLIVASNDARNSTNHAIEGNPFIVFKILMIRSIVPCYKSTEIYKVVDDYLPKSELSRRKLMTSSAALEKYRKAVLEAAAEISHEYSENYWKNILQNGDAVSQNSSNPASSEAIKNGFLFYLNSSGHYLVLREHLRNAISSIVQQKCLNLRPSGFQNHRDFQAYLHDMYVYLVDEMNEILTSTSLQETDPLNLNVDRLLQQTHATCSTSEPYKASLHVRQMADLNVFAEEAFAQGDLESCHKLHLQRVCRDKESSRSWTEFAIMWLSRGDDRMAEISVREALRKDPLHLYALLIAGMIAVRHGDERGLDCLGAALGLRPMCPEILVILGVANSFVGNEIAGDYFFRKAAYVHRTITGKSTHDIEKSFTIHNSRKPFNMKTYAQDMDAGVLPVPDSIIVREPFDPNVNRGGGMEGVPLRKTKGEGQFRGTSKLRMGVGTFSKEDIIPLKNPKSHNTLTASKMHFESNEEKDFGKLGRSLGKKQDLQTLQVQQGKKGSLDEDTVKGVRRKSNNSTKDTIKSASSPRGSVTGITGSPNTPPQSLGENHAPKFTFAIDINDIELDEVELPPLNMSVQCAWNVTNYDEKLEHHLLTVDYLKAAYLTETKSGVTLEPKTPLMTPSNLQFGGKKPFGVYNYIPKDDGVVADKELREEYDRLIIAPLEGDATGGGDNLGQTPLPKAPDTAKSGKKSFESQNIRVSRGGGGASTIFPGRNKGGSGGVEVRPPTEQVLEGAQLKKLTNRLGSELIWAANLLINLRLFDFADGILAKHLYFYTKRTLQFIYLRALSLHLRQRDHTALSLIKEGLEMDSNNAMLWALEGHCYYSLGQTNDAIISYEKALKLPHMNENRHLLYLRYGSLILDSGKSKLAKRVFLHGVTKYPTPYFWLAVGNACFQRQEYDQAESAFSEANRLDSTNPIPWGHLTLSSLAQGKQSLAEQAYKWAIRFGLRAGALMDEIHRVQQVKGFGNPSFPRVPTCVPHDYYLRRLGREKPLNVYQEALDQVSPLTVKDLENLAGSLHGEEWDGEDFFDDDIGVVTAFDGDDEFTLDTPEPDATSDGGSRTRNRTADTDVVTDAELTNPIVH